MASRLIAMAILIFMEATTGTLIWEFYFHQGKDGILSITCFAIAMTAFFGLLTASGSNGGKMTFTKGAMRVAIAGTVMVTYVYAFSIFTFVGYIGELPEISRILIDSLAAVVSVTVVFYFGSEAAIQLFGKDKSSESESSTDKKD